MISEEQYLLIKAAERINTMLSLHAGLMSFNLTREQHIKVSESYSLMLEVKDEIEAEIEK